jgi:hypothetical protein
MSHIENMFMFLAISAASSDILTLHARTQRSSIGGSTSCGLWRRAIPRVPRQATLSARRAVPSDVLGQIGSESR